MQKFLICEIGQTSLTKIRENAVSVKDANFILERSNGNLKWKMLV